ncbi:MAG: DNA-processing protein DprA [Candidatus Shapirobacteria bacterium]
MKAWNKYPIKAVSLKDQEFPSLLKKIPNPPKKIYYRGNLKKDIFQKSLSVVGSRRMSQAGKLAAEQIIAPLATAGVAIVSGFMYGIDTVAHQICLESGGVTIAVLGNGLDIVYPPENDSLYSQILNNNGAVISEYPAQTKPRLWTYPARNRIIAGLSSLGVLVIEAGENSGSLITVKEAIKQKKKVWAVPGLITTTASAGTNQLIQSGKAKMVLGAEDILGEKKKSESKEEKNLDPLEKEILESLKREPLDLNQLSRLINKDVALLSQIISLMSLKGLISEIGGQYYISSS